MKSIKIFTLTTMKLHKYLLLLGLFLLFLYAGFINYTFVFKTKDIANALQLSSFLIQSGMLFYMLLGFRLASKTLSEKTLYEIVKKKLIRIHFINIGLLLSSVLFYVITVMSFYIIYAYKLDSANSFGLEIFMFLLNYWLIPFFISGLIGYIFGVSSLNKVMYGLLIIIWSIISPANINFFGILSNTQLEEYIVYFNNLNLGLFNMNEYYNPFYGFEFNWFKKIGLLFFLIYVCIISILSINLNKVRKANLIVLIIGLILYSFISYDYIQVKIRNISTLFEEYRYYGEKTVPLKKNLYEYDIESMNVSINNSRELNVHVDVTINNIKSSNIAFTLYRGFQVKDILLPNGQNVPFTQAGDRINITLPSSMVSNSVILTFKYSGRGNFSNPATEKYMLLTSDFSWLPSNHPYPTRFVFNGELINSSLINHNTIKYSLEYKGKNKLDFVNLKQTEEGKYTGEASGITLISGDLVKAMRKGSEIYYPKSWFVYNNDIDSYLSQYQKILNKYNGIFSTNHRLPNRIVLIPSTDLNDNYMHINSIGDSNFIMLQINPVEFTQKRPMNDWIPFQIDRTYGINNGFSKPEKFVNWFIYNSLLGIHLSNQPYAYYKELKEYHIYLAETNISSEDKKTLNQLVSIPKEEQPDELFVKWKEILLDQNENDWKQIEKLLIELGLRN
ncbi:hypothetical protein [Peribacillus muralis]|uniref:hypothetical protein n=1 Tax=Peribacillus muralis TaxID=264697 RepID=UPI003D0422D9